MIQRKVLRERARRAALFLLALVFSVTSQLLFLPAAAAEDDAVNVAVLNLEGAEADAKFLEALTSMLRSEAQQYASYDVVNQTPISLAEMALVLGCSVDEIACMAEAAAQVDAQVLIYGQVENVGRNYLVTVEIFDVSRERIVRRMVRTLEGSDTSGSDTIAEFRKELQALFRGAVSGARVSEATLIQIDSNIPGTRISLNGEPLGEVPIERDDLPAGTYEIEAEREGYETWATRVKLTPGAEVSVLAYLVEARDTSAVAQKETSERAVEPPPEVDSARTNWGAWSAIGVGSAALAGSGVMAFLMHNTQKDVDALDERFANGEVARNPYLDERVDLDARGENLQTAHFVLLGVGGASAAAGIIWLLVDRGSSESSQARAASDERSLKLGLSPAGAWASWSW